MNNATRGTTGIVDRGKTALSLHNDSRAGAADVIDHKNLLKTGWPALLMSVWVVMKIAF